jgi:glycerol dehydrogenase-like iron-containing ADH family enzyme
VGHSRPGEGSEHGFAHNAEQHTGREHMHSELAGLGSLLMARLQKNETTLVNSGKFDKEVKTQ